MPFVDFKECCDNHDFCYGTCGKIKSDCDRKLGDCMRKKCDEALGFAYHEKALCYKMANAYEWAVKTFGEEAFEAGQDSGCVWEPCCNTRE